ncbi:MAG: hypothetical protein ASARMPRED_000661 [Alectoria sarmentosa]|nr:MAG: hypothetical protein ASARMPRED_000661 [Alectoria sarmentosa]
MSSASKPAPLDAVEQARHDKYVAMQLAALCNHNHSEPPAAAYASSQPDDNNANKSDDQQITMFDSYKAAPPTRPAPKEQMSTDEVLASVTVALSKLFEENLTAEDENLINDEEWVHVAADAAVARSVEEDWELLESA